MLRQSLLAAYSERLTAEAVGAPHAAMGISSSVASRNESANSGCSAVAAFLRLEDTAKQPALASNSPTSPPLPRPSNHLSRLCPVPRETMISSLNPRLEDAPVPIPNSPCVERRIRHVGDGDVRVVSIRSGIPVRLAHNQTGSDLGTSRYLCIAIPDTDNIYFRTPSDEDA